MSRIRAARRAAQRLPLSTTRITGSIESAQAYVAEELGEPGRFVPVIDSVAFPGRPGRTFQEPQELLAKTWNHVDWPGWRVTLPGGRVTGLTPLVLTEDRRALAESAFDATQLRSNPAWDRRLPPARRVRGTLLVLTGPWWNGWYHWVLDLLPRAALLPLDDEPDAPVLVPAGLSAQQDESLTLVGIPPERRLEFSGGQVRADELVFPSFVAPTGNPARWSLGWLRERLVPGPARRTRRIYVSRVDAAERRVVNEPELVAALAEWGFETVIPGTLSLREQVTAFAEAEIVLGPHGAGLTNLFASTDATLVELQRSDMVRPCYFAQANAQGLAYWYVLCEPAGPKDLSVDLAELRRTLEAVCAAGG